MEVFLGVPAVDGSGIGTAFVIPEPVKRAIPQHRIKIDELNEGWERFEIAVQTVTLQLSEHLDSLSKTSNKLLICSTTSSLFLSLTFRIA